MAHDDIMIRAVTGEAGIIVGIAFRIVHEVNVGRANPAGARPDKNLALTRCGVGQGTELNPALI